MATTTSCAIRIPGLHYEGLGAMVVQDDTDFAAVAGVDQAWCVEDADPVLEAGPTAAGRARRALWERTASPVLRSPLARRKLGARAGEVEPASPG